MFDVSSVNARQLNFVEAAAKLMALARLRVVSLLRIV